MHFFTPSLSLWDWFCLLLYLWLNFAFPFCMKRLSEVWRAPPWRKLTFGADSYTDLNQDIFGRILYRCKKTLCHIFMNIYQTERIKIGKHCFGESIPNWPRSRCSSGSTDSIHAWCRINAAMEKACSIMDCYYIFTHARQLAWTKKDITG